MPKLKQSLCWWCFNRNGMQPQRFFNEAKRIGYDAVELVPRDLWDAVVEAGLHISSHSAHASLTDGLNRRENPARIEDEINRNLELAVRYKVPTLICFSGNRNGFDDETGAANTAEGLRRVAKAAEDANVTLVLELLNSKVDHQWIIPITSAITPPGACG